MANGVNMPGLITDAYQIQHYQISGGPKWFDSEGFDIEAVAGKIPAGDQFRLMLQTLLADRFKLKFHRETKEISITGCQKWTKIPRRPVPTPALGAPTTFSGLGRSGGRLVNLCV